MIKEVLIVEGRSDVARIRASHIDADMITTDGFSLRPDTLRQIACAYKKRGIIILTDPDQAGPEQAVPQGQTCVYTTEGCHCQ